jgi:hypothetical protein
MWPLQSIAHEAAFLQSIPLPHALVPVHRTSQGTPEGQVMVAGHAPLPGQSNTHVPPSHAPPEAAQAEHAPAASPGGFPSPPPSRKAPSGDMPSSVAPSANASPPPASPNVASLPPSSVGAVS